MALAKGHLPTAKSQVSDIRTIGPLFYLILFTIITANVSNVLNTLVGTKALSTLCY